MKKLKTIIIALALLMSLPVIAEDKQLAALFARQGMEGTIVISSLKTGQTFMHNETRAQQRFPVASTFKIMNTLIALEEKAIAGKDDSFKWDGHSYDFPNWNHDQTLESAFKVSCVWCYQELARRIGTEKYRHYLHQADYGALHEPFELTMFWLDGSLTISAMEQIHFLKKVYLQSLPFSPAAYGTLRQIMLVEKNTNFSIWAKTGWATRTTPQVGWYVGYVETPKDTWFFALNLIVRDAKDLPLRQHLTREALRAKGIINPG